jgi:hypothetical protein
MKRINKSHAISVLNKADKLKKRELKRTIIVPGPGSGDRLAQGAASVTYRMPEVSEEQWDRVFLTDEEFLEKYGHA